MTDHWLIRSAELELELQGGDGGLSDPQLVPELRDLQ